MESLFQAESVPLFKTFNIKSFIDENRTKCGNGKSKWGEDPSVRISVPKQKVRNLFFPGVPENRCLWGFLQNLFPHSRRCIACAWECLSPSCDVLSIIFFTVKIPLNDLFMLCWMIWVLVMQVKVTKFDYTICKEVLKHRCGDLNLFHDERGIKWTNCFSDAPINCKDENTPGIYLLNKFRSSILVKGTFTVGPKSPESIGIAFDHLNTFWTRVLSCWSW